MLGDWNRARCFVKGLSQIKGPCTIFEPGGLPWIFETVWDASEIYFYGFYGYLSNGARSIPGRYLKNEISPLNKPPLNLLCSVLLNTFWEVRTIYTYSETVLLMGLSTRVHSLNEKKQKQQNNKHKEKTQKARKQPDTEEPLVSPNLEPECAFYVLRDKTSFCLSKSLQFHISMRH